MKSNYATYQFNDFLMDQDFLDFVKDPSPERVRYWEGILESHPGLREEFDLARQSVEMLRYQRLRSGSGSKDEIWNRIEHEIDAAKAETKPGVLRRFWPYMAAAASVLVIAVYMIFLRTDMVLEQTPMAQSRMIRLPDSSYITINAGSELSYDRLHFAAKRTVHLKGEAYFQVRRGSEFVVETDLGKVRVLGTTFNVYSRGAIMNVSCLTGKVGVMFAQVVREYILTSGMTVSTENQQVRSTTFDIESYKSWREGFFYYDNAPLVQVVEELQRQYNIKDLDLSNNALKYRYTGFFRKDNLADALQSVFLPLKLRADLQNGVLSIKEEQ